MRTTKKRRGSTLVMVAFMLVAFMAMGAIAADIGRFYVVTGELQTAADAAALKGASVLQFSTNSNLSGEVSDSVMAWAQWTNRADGNNLTVAVDSIKLVYWTPGNPGSYTTELGTNRPNAVYVAVTRQPQGVFAQVIGRSTGYNLTRHAVAWIGNISLQCIRPWALPYSPFYRRVNNLAPTANVGSPAPDVTSDMMVKFQATPTTNRTFIVLPPGPNYQNPLWTPNDSNWRGYNPPSNQNGNANSGKSTYQDFLLGCNNVAVNSDAGNGNTVPNQGNGNSCGAIDQTSCWTREVIDQPRTNGGGNNTQNNPICAAFRANDAGCYATTTSPTPGVTIDMAWADIVGNGQSVDFRYVGEFDFKCFFKNTTDVCAAIPGPKKSNYPVGTIVGVASGLKSRKLNPTDIISNTPSNVQRLFLVE
jgi:Flp pilus assembly protein TadG